MYSRSLSWISLGTLGLMAALAAACDGGSGSTATGDGAVRPEAGGGGSDANNVIPVDGRPLGGEDGSLTARPDMAPPMINTTAKKILPARSQLLGLHQSGCSYGKASKAAGTSWCAISRPGAILGQLELWVFDAKVAASTGTANCTAGSTTCIKLSENLYGASPSGTGGPVYPTSHRFYGDTLIYYANAKSAATDLYQGPIYAWQAGWPAPRQIASDNGILCSGHSGADVAVCLENISAASDPTTTFDLHAGPITGQLPLVQKIYPVQATSMATQWRSGFNQDGSIFAFSTGGATAAARETLYTVPTASLTGTVTPTPVGSPATAVGISRWTISADGKHWFYLRDFNYDTMGAPSGTLYTADFPTGANEKKIQSVTSSPALVPGGTTGGVGAFQVLSDENDVDQGVGFLGAVASSMGNYSVIKNPQGSPDDPANVIKVLQNVSSLPVMSNDLKYGFYAKDFDDSPTSAGTSDAWVVKGDGTNSCSLTTTLLASIFGVPFPDHSGSVFWVDNYDATTDSGEGWVANPEACASKSKFASAIDFWFINGDASLLYSAESDGDTATLYYAPLSPGAVGSVMPVQKQVQRLYTVLPDWSGLFYAIASGVDSLDGIYYYPLAGGGTGGAVDASAGN